MTAGPGQWVLASSNSGKLEEIRTLLRPLGVEIVPQDDFGVTAAEETGSTFVENALLKARHATAQAGLPAIADDSGLAVDALGGAPGVRSARFAGAAAEDSANVAKLLAMLTDVPVEQRGARFHCVLVALTHAHDPAPLLSHGEWVGLIAREPRGEGGFGYDPVFFDPRLQSTAAELTMEEKNRVSHRGRALRALARQLTQRWPAA